MILFLQLLSVTVSGAAVLVSFFLILGPFLISVIHGRGATINPWHGVALAVAAALFMALVVAYGWVSL